MTIHPPAFRLIEASSGSPNVIDVTVPSARRPADSPVRVRHEIVASVGTDHHPFDRLVQWMDEWLSSRNDGPNGVEYLVTVQYGSSQPPRQARGSALLANQELRAAMAGASAIVTHGGPATIRDARAAGRRPFVVPRDPRFGEHVDDHQMRFTRLLAEQGDIVLCLERDQLFEALNRAVTDGAWSLVDSRYQQTETDAAIARVAGILDDVLASSRARRRVLL